MTPVVFWTGLVCSFALLLVGCAKPAPDAGAEEKDVKMPRDVIAFRVDLGNAEDIVDECPRGFRLNRAYERERVREFKEKYGPDPEWADLKMEDVMTPRRLQRKFIGYVQRRNVVIAEPETWCAAGRAEVAEKTRIGKLLIAR
ncbi:MAG TPA: DUF5333 family protein [Albidovulum sp.]|uniref:DUF5333 family protein n=1 Tax=Albidovulum sp. TaxID=1872424 RepID=UPI002CE88EA0|nr:DUF5333 family protein [Albidovulum sp.]